MKQRYLSLLIALILVLSQLQAVFALSPPDANNHWAQSTIEKWVTQGYIDGYADGSFKPNQEVSRAEFAKLVNKAFHTKEGTAAISFSDVQASDWFYNEIKLGVGAGYISGYPDGTFKPNHPISRQEAAVVIHKVLKLEEAQQDNLSRFKDAQSIPGWSKGAVNAIVKLGIMQGYEDATFQEDHNITRAETIVMLDRALAKLDTNPTKAQGISGFVTLDGKPVEGAIVKLFAKDGYKVLKTATTDKNGAYNLEAGAGTFDITVEKSGSLGYKSDIVVKDGDVTLQNVSLTKGVKVTGKVVNSSGTGVAGKEISFTTNPTFVTTTDENGAYSLYVLPDKTYTIRHLDGDTYKELAANIAIGNTDKDLGALVVDGSTSGSSSSRSRHSNNPNAGRDVTPPTFAITSPALSVGEATYATFSQTQTIKGTAADDVMVARIDYSVDGGTLGTAAGTTVWSIADLPLHAGENKVTVTAVDLSDNKASTTITIIREIDKVAPALDILIPAKDATYTTESSSIAIGGTASDNDVIASITYSVQGGPSGTAEGTEKWLIANVDLLPGSNVIMVTATDRSGNTTRKSITVVYNVDKTAPAVVITLPTSEATYVTSSPTVTLSGTAADNKALKSVTYSVYGTTKSAVGTDMWTIPDLQLQLGENKVTITAEDESGNTANKIITIIYDPDAPAIFITSPSTEPYATVYQSILTLSGTARDNQALSSVTYAVYYDSVTDGVYGTAVGTANWSIPNLQLKPGYNMVTVTATDSANNKVSASIIIFNAVDTDSDGLPDFLEATIGTDPANPDTDGDGLLDGYEYIVLQTDPLKRDTDGNGVTDDAEDFDADGLTNIQEMALKTNPYSADSDGDGLPDSQEIATYRTDPMKKDTDGDGLGDGGEIRLGFDPLKADTDGNGVIDSEEKISQAVDGNKFSSIANSLTSPSLTIHGSGDINESISISDATNLPLIQGNSAIVGKVMDIKLPNPFDSAQISFTVRPEALTTHSLNDLVIAWFKEDGTIIPLETTIDPSTGQLTTTVTHFSKYGVIDLVQLALNWELTTESATVEKGQADIVFILDTTGSMGSTINNVKSNIINFVDKLDGDKVSVRLGLVEYKDIIEDGPSSTKTIGWYTDPEQFKNKVSGIDVYGGGDLPESSVDALEEARRMQFRKNVTQFMVLVTDADYKEETRFEEVKSMNEEIALIQKDGIITSVIGSSYDKNRYGDLYQKTDGLWADITDNFSVTLDQLKDKITSKTNDGVWVRLNTGRVVKLNKEPDKLDTVTDTDGDTVPDSKELNEKLTVDLPNWVRAILTARFPGKTFPDKVEVWTYHSDPTRVDSDNDNKSDLIDERPLVAYKPAVVLIHGINSSTGSAWGAENDVDNNGMLSAAFSPLDSGDMQTGKFTRDISGNETYTGNSYKKSDTQLYSNIDTQYIRGALKSGEFAEYLVSEGYSTNNNLLIFNWEANDHVSMAAKQFQQYLVDISKHFKDNNEDVDIWLGGRPQFDLVGHSAGGLVSRMYIENYMDDSLPHIDSLVTVDTPHWGSNFVHNPGGCGTFGHNVLDDLDRDDSYLWYLNEWNVNRCLGKIKGEALKLNHSSTNYYLIAGYSFGVGLPWQTKEPLLARVPKEPTDLELYRSVRDIVKTNTGYDPGKAAQDSLIGGLDLTSETLYGDIVVTVGSQLGVPSEKQTDKWLEGKRPRYIGATDQFIYAGNSKKTMHTTIEHQRRIHELIYKLLNGIAVPDISNP
ncbi:S-layer homology domain-containing protein [Paenibacillus sp. UNC451MF]|uniref:S-layer homology domain-containing protein n=1 Tax=Paenibacillus sp. UNC451MF TaxID=1449063 RepID=UPI00068B77EA|nr:S-layer homology domain-containing protein [Paenibacillus sp. UNC451MF]